jgi:hypothetical protein
MNAAETAQRLSAADPRRAEIAAAADRIALRTGTDANEGTTETQTPECLRVQYTFTTGTGWVALRVTLSRHSQPGMPGVYVGALYGHEMNAIYAMIRD